MHPNVLIFPLHRPEEFCMLYVVFFSAKLHLTEQQTAEKRFFFRNWKFGDFYTHP